MKAPNNIVSFKRLAFLAIALAIVSTVGVGCNTLHGFGRDVERTGEKIEAGAKGAARR